MNFAIKNNASTWFKITCILAVLSGFFYPLVIIGFVSLIATGILFTVEQIKKRNVKKSNDIPKEEILAMFNEAERRYTEADGKIEPNQILWDLYNERIRNKPGAGKPIPTGRALPTPVDGREEFSSNIINAVTSNQQPVSSAHRDNRKNIFRRRNA
jgi:hypothetical protein